MRKKLIMFISMVLISSLFLSTSGLSHQDLNTNQYQMNENNFNIDDGSTASQHMYPVMRVNTDIIKTWKSDYNEAKKAAIDQNLENSIANTEDFSILHLLNYDAEERDQHWCSNCWSWPATSIIAIALNVQEGIYDRLSVQYINSCGTVVGSECCEGGNLNIFARFYRYVDMAIPWSNENAHWIDKYAQCNTPCESISTEPNYPISSIYPETIETHEIPEEEAIENVKNILHQQKGVYFSWYLPDMEYREHFSNYWQQYSEESVYDLDWACGVEFNDETGGGHAVLCVGYHDEEGTNNDYWIMLNSWGAPNSRPNGLFRVNMHMDYDCTMLYAGHEYYSFDFQTLDISFGTEEEAPDPPSINGPSMGKPGTDYTFDFSAIDYQDDEVYIMIDWGDGETTDWIGPLSSEEIIQRSHTWDSRDEYFLRAKAKDERDQESLWATHEISMSKMKMKDMQWNIVELFLFHLKFLNVFDVFIQI